jgi:hypothetical protein
MVYTSYMPDIVVRELEGELVRKVRADAAMRGESLKEWVVRVCEEATKPKVEGRRQDKARGEGRFS